MKILLCGIIDFKWKQVADWIEGIGHEIECCGAASECLQKIEQDPEIDAIIIDIDGGDKEGLSLAQQIKRSARLQTMPVVFAGEGIVKERVFEYSRAGVDDIILLPTAPQTLNAKLAHLELICRKSVLLVDDEPALLDLLQNIFEIERFRVYTASNGREALENLNQHRIDAVVTDVMMPVMTGTELLVEVKATYPWVPVVFITGFSGRLSPQDALAMGADGYFNKPFHNMELIYILRSLLARFANMPRLEKVSTGADKVPPAQALS